MDFTKYNIDENDEELKSLIECDMEKKVIISTKEYVN